MKEVYVVYEVNSPELSVECGTFELDYIYDSYEKADAYAKTVIDSADKYKVVATYKSESETSYLLYQYGNEDSPIWFEIHIEKKRLL